MDWKAPTPRHGRSEHLCPILYLTGTRSSIFLALPCQEISHVPIRIFFISFWPQPCVSPVMSVYGHVNKQRAWATPNRVADRPADCFVIATSSTAYLPPPPPPPTTVRLNHCAHCLAQRQETTKSRFDQLFEIDALLLFNQPPKHVSVSRLRRQIRFRLRQPRPLRDHVPSYWPSLSQAGQETSPLLPRNKADPTILFEK